MPTPRFEILSGAVDGVNTVFTASMAYTSGTSAVFLNGQLKVRTYDDGWSETNPALGIITLTEAPLPQDVVQMFYIDTSPVLPGEEISTLTAEITEMVEVEGAVTSMDYLDGSLEVTL